MAQQAGDLNSPGGFDRISPPQTPEPAQKSKKKALIVGINNYPAPNALPSCVADARAMSALLSDEFGFADRKILLDADASKTNLVYELGQLVSGCGPADRLVFFFSGHGYRPVRNGVLESALVTQDAQFFEDNELADLMKDVPPGILTIITDACFSGGIEKLFVKANGQIEVGKLKRWISLDPREVESHSDEAAAATRFSPFGYLSPAPVAALQDNMSMTKSPTFQISQLRQSDSKAILVSACLEDETAAASTSQTQGMSAFTYALTSTIGSIGANPSSQAVIEAAGQRLREIGIKQTPMLKCPPQPVALASQEFILLNEEGGTPPVQNLATTTPTQTDQHDSEQQTVARAIATFLLMRGRVQMPSDIQQKDLSDIIRVAVPLISMLQRTGVGVSAADKGLNIGQIAGAVLPTLIGLQSKGTAANGNGPANKDFLDDVGRVAGIVVPIIAALQSKGALANSAADKSLNIGQIAGAVLPNLIGLQSKGTAANASGPGSKDFLDDIGRVAGIVVPIIAALQSKGALSNGAADKSLNIGQIAGAVLPALIGLQSKGAVVNGNGTAHKDFLDDVSRIVDIAGKVVPLIAGAQSKGIVANGNDAASKDLINDIGRVIDIVGRVGPLVGLQTKASVTSGNGAADKDFLDDVGRVANIVVPIIAGLQASSSNRNGASKDFLDLLPPDLITHCFDYPRLDATL
jgi:hypothetical protein